MNPIRKHLSYANLVATLARAQALDVSLVELAQAVEREA
jgi:hypothetical protein